MKSKFCVLIYYQYIDIPDPKGLMVAQKALCEELGLKGRIIIAGEGINGTVEGTVKNTEKYIKATKSNTLFKNMRFKKSAGTGVAFPKLSIKVRPEIVRLGVPDINPNQQSGKYLESEKLHEWFMENQEFFIVDMRNDYEYESGYFEGSIFAGIHNFYDLPKILPKLKSLKNKTVVTVCTAGVRCEKASGLLLSNGFKDVYQLKDGIQSYMEKYPNEHFKGKLYVFDNRLTIGYNLDDPSHEIVGKCRHCSTPSDQYVNCAYDFCHFHYLCCDNCKDPKLNLAFCNSDCKKNYLASRGD